MVRTIAALLLFALATSTANLPLAVAFMFGGVAVGATVPDATRKRRKFRSML